MNRLLVGHRVECTVCHRTKKPWGRDASLGSANGYCDHSCGGYRLDPQPGDLWPGEKREDFGFPDELVAIAQRISELEADASKLAEVVHDLARLDRICPVCGSASHVRDGHAEWCCAGKHLRLGRARALLKGNQT